MRPVPCNSILCFLILLLFCGGVSSCSSEPEEITFDSSYYIRFTLSPKFLKGNETRSSSNDIDNRIDAEQLAVVCFDSEDNIVSVYSPDDIIEAETGFSIKVDKADYIDSFAVLANWNDYNLEIGNVRSKNELKKLRVGYKGEVNLIPMYGEAEFISEENENITVEMSRSLAKIEVRDKLEEYEIVGAYINEYGAEISVDGSPCAVSSSKTLPFLHDEENKLFYLYIPPIELGDEDSERRKIEISLKDKSGAILEENYTLCLKDYDEENSEPDKWSQLRCNILYSFNVQGIDMPTPPDQGDSGSLEIRWWPTENGKFSVWNYLYKYTGIRLLLKNSDSEEIKVFEPRVEWHNDLSDGFGELYVSVDLAANQLIKKDLQYLIVDMDVEGESLPEQRWNDEFAGNLLEEASEIENSDEETSVIRLNKIPLLYINGKNKIMEFPKTYPYRIYWKNRDIETLYKLQIRNNNTPWKDLPTQLTCGSENKYRYVEYHITTSYSVTAQQLQLLESDPAPYDELQTQDFFIRTIDGTDYCVFYIN
ncbi:MAG: FimB/Mfa2 family fimbrial subunit [Muribaculaceae bacterium]|nr:FimB/Mfa2 family fimbrial subunit [Muribaculaceae bacterium]